MAEDMQVRNLSPHTQSTYVLQVSQFACHFGKSPHLLGPEHIRAYPMFDRFSRIRIRILLKTLGWGL